MALGIDICEFPRAAAEFGGVSGLWTRPQPSTRQPRALALGKATGTPVYVMKNGRIVNLNPESERKKRS